MDRRSAEIKYLQKLINDFPAEYEVTEASKAYNQIAARYQFYEQNVDFLSEILISESNSQDLEFQILLYEFALRTHSFLFDEILSNAGEFRKSSDPGGGGIHFGGQRHQQHRSRFVGSVPNNIESELSKAFAHLVRDSDKPLEQALRFYQHFVKIHPFYDANGRIGRVIVSVYLYIHGYYVLWAKFDGPNNAEFIKKLNECHKRMDSGFRFERYFQYLYSFVKKYIVSLDELGE